MNRILTQSLTVMRIPLDLNRLSPKHARKPWNSKIWSMERKKFGRHLEMPKKNRIFVDLINQRANWTMEWEQQQKNQMWLSRLVHVDTESSTETSRKGKVRYFRKIHRVDISPHAKCLPSMSEKLFACKFVGFFRAKKFRCCSQTEAWSEVEWAQALFLSLSLSLCISLTTPEPH